jgi:uncharacterized protein YkuJ
VKADLANRALSLLRTFEQAGRPVKRVVIDGRKLEFEFVKREDSQDEFDGIDMRHDQT